MPKKKRGKGRQLEAVPEAVPTQTEAPYTENTGIAVGVTTQEANEVSTDTNFPENGEEVDDDDHGDDEYEPEGSGEEEREGSSTTTEEGNFRTYNRIPLNHLYYVLTQNDIYKICNQNSYFRRLKF